MKEGMDGWMDGWMRTRWSMFIGEVRIEMTGNEQMFEDDKRCILQSYAVSWSSVLSECFVLRRNDDV